MRIILKPPQTVASPRRTGAVAATLIWRLASKAIVKGSPKVSAMAAFILLIAGLVRRFWWRVLVYSEARSGFKHGLSAQRRHPVNASGHNLLP